jgi:hypothetical protein
VTMSKLNIQGHLTLVNSKFLIEKFELKLQK